jgi:hypothetical protein
MLVCKLCKTDKAVGQVAGIDVCKACRITAEIRLKADRKFAKADGKKWVDAR